MAYLTARARYAYGTWLQPRCPVKACLYLVRFTPFYYLSLRPRLHSLRLYPYNLRKIVNKIEGLKGSEVKFAILFL